MELSEYISNTLNLEKKSQSSSAVCANSLPNLSNLPAELIIKILLNCHPITILRMQSVCAYIMQIAADNYLWEEKCVRHFVYPYRYLKINMSVQENGKINWKNVFKNYYLSYFDRGCSKEIKQMVALISENDIAAISRQTIHLEDLVIPLSVNLFSGLLLGASKSVLNYVYFNLVEDYLSLDKKDKHGWTKIHWAAYCNQLVEYKKLTYTVRQDFASNTTYYGCCPPTIISLAAEYGHLEFVRYLLNKNIPPDFTNRFDTPLCLSVKNGFKDIVILLIAHGANVNHVGSQQETSLIKAIKYHQLHLIEILISSGAKINLINCFGTPLIYAIKIRCLRSIEILLKQGADPNLSGNTYLQTPLCMAIECNDLDVIQLLLTYRADIKRASYFQNCYPLLVAAQNGSISAAKILINNGADVNCVGQDGRSALWIAANHGNCEMIHLLLQNKAVIDLANFRGETPLWRAVFKEHIKAVELLLIYNANVNRVDCRGHTSIDIAINFQLRNILNLLKISELINKCLHNCLTEQSDFDCLSSLTSELACHWFASLSNSINFEKVEKIRQCILQIYDVLFSPLSQLDLRNNIHFDKNEDVQLLNLCFAALLKSGYKDKNDKLKKLRNQAFAMFKAYISHLIPEQRIEKLRYARTQSIFCQHRASFFKPATTNTVKQIDEMIEYESKNILKI
jgi:ankyrin repeat protein